MDLDNEVEVETPQIEPASSTHYLDGADVAAFGDGFHLLEHNSEPRSALLRLNDHSTVVSETVRDARAHLDAVKNDPELKGPSTAPRDPGPRWSRTELQDAFDLISAAGPIPDLVKSLSDFGPFLAGLGALTGGISLFRDSAKLAEARNFDNWLSVAADVASVESGLGSLLGVQTPALGASLSLGSLGTAGVLIPVSGSFAAGVAIGRVLDHALGMAVGQDRETTLSGELARRGAELRERLLDGLVAHAPEGTIPELRARLGRLAEVAGWTYFLPVVLFSFGQSIKTGENLNALLDQVEQALQADRVANAEVRLAAAEAEATDLAEATGWLFHLDAENSSRVDALQTQQNAEQLAFIQHAASVVEAGASASDIIHLCRKVQELEQRQIADRTSLVAAIEEMARRLGRVPRNMPGVSPEKVARALGNSLPGAEVFADLSDRLKAQEGRAWGDHLRVDDVVGDMSLYGVPVRTLARAALVDCVRDPAIKSEPWQPFRHVRPVLEGSRGPDFQTRLRAAAIQDLADIRRLRARWQALKSEEKEPSTLDALAHAIREQTSDIIHDVVHPDALRNRVLHEVAAHIESFELSTAWPGATLDLGAPITPGVIDAYIKRLESDDLERLQLDRWR